jgi:glucosamine--fructose-6-phosphate aminotransferase (isomerizing)
MGPTEQTIVEQFSYWERALSAKPPLRDAEQTVFVGCGTSYNLALSLATLANAAGRRAIAVPGGEWVNRPQSYLPEWQKAHVVALSRSGETTETVAAAVASRAAGAFVTAITMEADSALAQASDRCVLAATHPREGIVMTTSASLMLLLGLQLLGHPVDTSTVEAAQRLLTAVDSRLPALVAGRSHFVYLGGGSQYGVALEGALKLMEMSQIYTQAFHPLEYRHGPISLVDAKTAAIMLYSREHEDAEATLVRELQAKGALVIGFGGPGDFSFAIDCPAESIGLVCLPALQLLGERSAQIRNIDTISPRHLTKVVTLA